MQDMTLLDLSALAERPTIAQNLEEVAHLFAHAESLLKKAERVTSEVPIPLINELRYAGSHLTRSMLEREEAKRVEDIQKAKNHCERAIFDAYEIMLIYYLDNFRHFAEQYATVSLNDLIPSYVTSKKYVREASDFVSKYTRKDERVQYCVHAKEHLEILKPLWESYDDAREEIVKIAKKERRSFLFAFFSMLVGLAGLLVAAYKGFAG